jgi:hypothetical protein
LWLGAWTHAHAQPPAPVELQLPSCLETRWRNALLDSARLELQSDGAQLVTEPGAANTTHAALDLPCGASPDRARIVLTGAERERIVELADVPVALRARALALALAELWRSSTASARGAEHASAQATPLAAGAVSQPRTASARGEHSAAAPRQTAPPEAASRTPALDERAQPRAADASRDSVKGAAGEAVQAQATAASLASAGPAPSAAGQPLVSAPSRPDGTGTGQGVVPLMAANASRASDDGVVPRRAPSVSRAKPARADVAAALDGSAAEPLMAAGRSAAAKPADSSEAERAADGLGAEPAGAGLFAAAATRVYLAGPDALPGAQLGCSWGRLRVGGEGFYGWRSDALGSARFGVLQAFVSWELLRIRLGAYGLALAPRAAVGGVFASATAALPGRGDSMAILSWDAAGEAAFWRKLGDRWSLALRLHAGFASGVRLASDAGALAQLHGPFAAASLALASQLTDAP